MQFFKRLRRYLNPIAHLGAKDYSLVFPFVSMVLIAVTIELHVQYILKDPSIVAMFVIFPYVALIIYFAFRSGIRAGWVATAIVILHCCYIIYSRNYEGDQLRSGIQSTILFSVVYLGIAWVIGWLKQTIDTLIEREANEKRRLHTILQQLPAGIFVCNAKGQVEYANKQIEKITGKPFHQNLLAYDRLDIKGTYKGRIIQSEQWPFVQALRFGKTINKKDVTLLHDDGRKVNVQISVTPIKNRHGEIIGAVSLLTDVTDQKELEARKDDFVNMASHELKTPITSLKLYADILCNHVNANNDVKGVSIINHIEDQIDRLQKLVTDLLDVSRLQTGKFTYTKERFNLFEVASQTVAEIAQSAKDKQISVSGNSSTWVYADKFRTSQVLSNLLTNAIKYSPKGGRILVKVKNHNGSVAVSVKDNGIGIAEKHQRKIFNRLYQVNDDNGKTFPGFGMGLYISKKIVKSHRGRMWVESKIGKGSTFHFTLPTVKKRVN